MRKEKKAKSCCFRRFDLLKVLSPEEKKLLESKVILKSVHETFLDCWLLSKFSNYVHGFNINRAAFLDMKSVNLIYLMHFFRKITCTRISFVPLWINAKGELRTGY